MGGAAQALHFQRHQPLGDEADPEWLAYTQGSAKLGALVRQENRLMVPASFCPLRR
jgi:hypothetical protein